MGILDWFARLRSPREEDAESEEPDGGDAWDPFPDPAAIPVHDVLDLHGLPPRMVREVVEEYLGEARRLGFRYVRIVHGKGIGVQREIVRGILGRTPWVEAFGDAPPEAGGWGATVVTLSRDSNGAEREPEEGDEIG